MNFRSQKFLLMCSAALFSLSARAQVPAASFSTSSNTVCAETPVQVTDMSSNAPNAWSYSVNGVATSTAQNPEFTFTTSGTYSIDLEATNGIGTSTVYTQTVSVQALPVITVSGNTLVCTQASETLTANGADTYTWDSGSNQNSVVINPPSNSIYTLVGTSTLTGCSDSVFVTVNTLPLPTITVVNNATICPGESYTISPSGASSYTFSSGSGVVTPTANTSYMVTGMDASTGCSNTEVVSIAVTAVSITANSGSVCLGQSYTITPNGASSYTFSSGSNVVTPAANSIYTVYGSYSSAGCTGSVAVSLNVVPIPTISVSSGTVCAGKVFTLHATGAVNYTYSTGSDTVIPTTNTTYVVSGRDPVTGCVDYASASVTVFTLPVISVNSGTVCSGGIFTITPTGASTYTFSEGGFTVMPLTSMSFSITGTDVHGCISPVAAVSSVVVSGTQPTIVILSSKMEICIGDTAILTALGASHYTWSTGATTSTVAITPTVTSIFTIVGEDGSTGCLAGSSKLQYVGNCVAGIGTIDSDLPISVYPNPTNGELNVESADNDIEISVTNTMGEIILKERLSAGKQIMDLQSQASGIYFVRLRKGNAVKVLRIVKE